jgi:hypothetical protein
VKTLAARFASHTVADVLTGCLTWVGGLDDDGYGKTSVGRATKRATQTTIGRYVRRATRSKEVKAEAVS